MFMISDRAAEEFKKSAAALGETDTPLRLKARKVPQEGIVYKMGFDNAKDDDIPYTINEVRFVLDKETDGLVDKMIVDYRDLNGTEQFVFVNPNDVKEDCGTDKASCTSKDSNNPACQGCE